MARIGLIVTLLMAGLLSAAGPASAATTTLASRASGPGGAVGNGFSGTDDRSVAISADGRYVAFQSAASNLVAGDTNGVIDVFVRDTQAAATTRVSVSSSSVEADGDSLKPVISGDGRYVAFFSAATNLVPGDGNGTVDVFVHDTETATTSRVSVATGGAQANDRSREPAISADGRHVVFQSEATNLVAGDSNGTWDVFVHDLDASTTRRVSVDAAGGQASGPSLNPALSADGSLIAFQSDAANLVAGDTNGQTDIFVRDHSASATQRVSVDSAGAEGNGASSQPSISGDGQRVAFQSVATNLVADDTNIRIDVFVRDLPATTTERVSVGPAGAQANDFSGFPAISADGRMVGYHSRASNLVAGDSNASQDVFLHDVQAGTTDRVSVTGAGGQSGGGIPNSDSNAAALSGEGRHVAFSSRAANLVAGDTNSTHDVFVRTTGDTEAPAAPASLTASPGSPSNSDPGPEISGSAEAGSTIRIYTDPACADLDAAGGSGQAFGAGIAASDAPNTTRTFYATATDAAGNTSPCSTSSVTYTHDSIPPDAPTLDSPAADATVDDATPTFRWNAAAGARAYDLFVDGNRVRAGIAGTEATAPDPLSPGTHSWRVRAIDAAANATDSAERTFAYTPPDGGSTEPPPLEPTPPTPPPAAPSVELRETGEKAELSGRKLDTGLDMVCREGGEQCAGTVELLAAVNSRGSGKALRKREEIGSSRFTIEPGEARAVVVKLNRLGRSVARRERKLRATLRFTLRSGVDFTTTTESVTLKIRR